MVFIHFSDTHLVLKGDDLFKDGSAFRQMDALFEDIEYRGIKPDVFLFSGDLCFHEPAACYEAARKALERNLGKFGVPVVIALGNHDNAKAFREGYLGIDGGHESFFGSTIVGEMRILTLDSRHIVEGSIFRPEGNISEEQLFWLKSELKKPCTQETVLLLHHPPTQVPNEQREMILNQEGLWDVLAGHKIAGVLCGHTHEASLWNENGILCAIAPGALNGRINNPAVGKVSITREAGYNIGRLEPGKLMIQTKYVNPQREQDRAFTIAELEKNKSKENEENE